MKKYLLGFFALALLLAPSTSFAKGVNTSGATLISTGAVADPDRWGELDVTGFLAGTNQLSGEGTYWRGRFYDQGVTKDTQAIFFSTIVLQEKVVSLENTVANLQAQISALQMSQNPVGGYPEQPVVVQPQNDLTPRMEALEKRVGYLEMALDYFNGYVGKFKSALKIK